MSDASNEFKPFNKEKAGTGHPRPRIGQTAKKKKKLAARAEGAAKSQPAKNKK